MVLRSKYHESMLIPRAMSLAQDELLENSIVTYALRNMMNW